MQLIRMDISKYACASARNKNIAIEFIWTGWILSGWRSVGTYHNKSRTTEGWARTRRREQQMHRPTNRPDRWDAAGPFAKLPASCICTLVCLVTRTARALRSPAYAEPIHHAGVEYINTWNYQIFFYYSILCLHRVQRSQKFGLSTESC